jgi:hypothetical protein
MSACLIVVASLQKILEARTNIGLIAGGIIAIFLFQIPAMGCWQILCCQDPSEILKYSQRAKGLALSQALGYAFSFLYTYTFPIAIQNISWRYFLINGCWNLGIVLVLWFLYIETKGKMLEEMDDVLDSPLPWSQEEHILEGLEPHKTKTNDRKAQADLGQKAMGVNCDLQDQMKT